MISVNSYNLQNRLTDSGHDRGWP